MIALLLALALAAPLPVTASPERVSWDGPAGACVYLVEAGGSRWRLGCSRGQTWEAPPGVLYPGDLIEVRSPAIRQRGRAIVGP